MRPVLTPPKQRERRPTDAAEPAALRAQTAARPVCVPVPEPTDAGQTVAQPLTRRAEPAP